jgi:hypothetical protein
MSGTLPHPDTVIRDTLPACLLAASVACSGGTSSPAPAPAPAPAATAPAAPPPVANAEAGGHEHEAPHGGSLVELGEEFAHLELVFDPTSGLLTVYALDGEAERPVRLAAAEFPLQVRQENGAVKTVTLRALANTLTGETVGDSSQFQAAVPDLKGAQTFSGVFASVSIRGQVFSDVAFDYPTTDH